VRIVEEGQIVNRDDRWQVRVKRRNEISCVKEIEPKAEQLHGQHDLLKAGMHGCEERPAPKTTALDNRDTVFAVLKHNELVVEIEVL